MDHLKLKAVGEIMSATRITPLQGNEIIRRVFQTEDFFGIPAFTPCIEKRILLCKTGHHLLRERQYAALIRTLKEMPGEEHFICFALSWEIGKGRTYLSCPVDLTYKEYRSFAIPPLAFFPLCLCSQNAKWGIMLSDEWSAAVGGTQEFIEKFKHYYPPWQYGYDNFVEFWTWWEKWWEKRGKILWEWRTYLEQFEIPDKRPKGNEPPAQERVIDATTADKMACPLAPDKRSVIATPNMPPIEALVTLARRYCLDNYDYWCKEYSEKRTGNDFPYTYTDGDYDLFPRYNVLKAILLDVETLTGNAFSSLSECRELLLAAGQLGETVFTSGEQNAIALGAMNDERKKFLSYISKITESDLLNVEPLPYARHLLESESTEVRKLLLRHWNFDGGYWEPLVSCSPKPFLFLAMDNITPDDCEAIRRIVQGHSGQRLYRITEDRIDYQIDASLFDPYRSETIYCDSRYDWVVYGSHEGTTAFGGDDFVSYIQRLYRDREELINLMPPITVIENVDDIVTEYKPNL